MMDDNRLIDERTIYEMSNDIIVNSVSQLPPSLAPLEGQLSIREVLERFGDQTLDQIKANHGNDALDPNLFRIIEMRDNTVSSFRQANKHYETIKPYLEAIWKTYPQTEEWTEERARQQLEHYPVGVLLVPIDAYIAQHQLEDASPETTQEHIPAFLGFFSDFLKEWDTVGVVGGTEEEVDAALTQALRNLQAKGTLDKAIAETQLPIIYAKTALKMIDKISNNTFGSDVLVRHTAIPVNVQKRGSKKAIQAFVKIDYDKMAEVMQLLGTNKGLTLMEREIYDAVASLWDAGNVLITYPTIYKQMRGNKSARMTPTAEKEMDDAFAKCMYVPCYIDATGPAKEWATHKYKNTSIDNFVFEGPLLHAIKTTVTINGHEVKALQLLDTPLLYQYADLVNQVARWPFESLNTPVNKDSDTIVIQGELMRRISAMRKSPTLSKTITYQHLYDCLGKDLTRKQKMSIRTNVRTILADWIVKDEITAYEEITRGKTIYAVKIKLSSKERIGEVE